MNCINAIRRLLRWLVILDYELRDDPTDQRPVPCWRRQCLHLVGGRLIIYFWRPVDGSTGKRIKHIRIHEGLQLPMPIVRWLAVE